MLRRILLSLSLTLLALSSIAQSGSIKGSVKDSKTGEGVIAANIFVMGTTNGASADISGDFEITKVKAGTYSLIISFVSYKTDTLKNITVYPDQTTLVNTTLTEEGQQLQEIVIRGAKVTNTDVSIISEIKKNDLVAVGISAQQISMSQDRDAAQIMKRIPGVTIVGNRFINVRGLSERYSTVMLNGIIAPSSEVDSKAFSFDLIPSNMIDRMLVYKSGSAELPGEFAGAVVGINTKSVVEENSMSLSVSGSFRSQTTGKDVQLAQQHGKSDWIGRDDGTRGLPSGFSTTNLSSLSLADPGEHNTLVNATKSLPNNWGARSLKAAPDLRVNFDLSRTMRIGSIKLDNITSISYSHTNQRYESSQNFYGGYSDINKTSTPIFLFHDIRFTQTSRLGAVSNFTIHINPSHRIEFRNFYNQQGQDQSTFRTGSDVASGNNDVKNLAFNYLGKSLYSGQLSGKHSFTDAINFTWVLGYNNTSASQPDYRRIRSQRSTGTDIPFSIVIPPNASANDAGHFYSKLKEQTYSAAGNLEIKLNPSVAADRQSKIIAGYYLEQKDRTFDARWMSYKWISPDSIDNSLLVAPFSQLFTPAHINKFVLDEGTNVGPDNYDSYDGHSRLIAGYAGIVTPFADKFRLSAGLRIENNIQKIDVYDQYGKKLNKVNSPLTIPMPFANLSYNFTEKMLVRIAYSRTVNRPVFRELAPFNFYDFDRNANITGNPALKSATIQNVDLRWELYPSKSESISFGTFYKQFKNPIEQVLNPGSNLFYTYANGDKAVNYGIEAEVRKSLSALSSQFLNKLTFVFNGALIKSNIELPKNLTTLVRNRPLQGQSPYVANASVYYNNIEKGLQVSVQYNVFGKRIFAVGDVSNPNQYEMPRHQVDLTVSKQLNEHFELKFGVQDLLNQRYRIIQDSNGDKKITKVDEPMSVYRLGQYATLGVIWKF